MTHLLEFIYANPALVVFGLWALGASLYGAVFMMLTFKAGGFFEKGRPKRP